MLGCKPPSDSRCPPCDGSVVSHLSSPSGQYGLPSQPSWARIRLQCRRPQFNSWVGKIRWRSDRLPTPVFLGFPGGSAGKESVYNAGDLGSVPGLGRSPGEGKGYPLQYAGLENSMDCIVHRVTNKSDTTKQPSFHFTYYQHSDFSPHYGSHPQRIRHPFSKTSAFATKINPECP